MFFRKTVRVLIKDRDLAFDVKSGSNLYTSLVQENIIPPSLCGGSGECGKCRVKLSGTNIPKPTKKEKLVLAKINLDAGYRLACQVTVKNDTIVDTSEISMTAAPNVVLTPLSNLEKIDIKPADIEENTEDVLSIQIPDITEQKEIPTIERKKSRIVYSDTEHAASEDKTDFVSKDGLLLVQSGGRIKFFQYSPVIKNILSTDLIQDHDELISYIQNQQISGYIRDVLKINDVDRLIIISEESGYADGSENVRKQIFDIAAYTAFNIGVMPCELIMPLQGVSDNSLFLKMMDVQAKSKKRKTLMFTLGELEHTYYFLNPGTIKLPPPQAEVADLFGVAADGTNPVIDISDDLLSLKLLNEFDAPDSIPLHILLKAVAKLKTLKIIDSEYRIGSRADLSHLSLPLEYIVKIGHSKESNFFYLYTHKSGKRSLVISQELLDELLKIRNYIQSSIDYVEENIGNIDTIIINIPENIKDFARYIDELGFIPIRHKKNVVCNHSDPSVAATRFFEEKSIPDYVGKHFGKFYIAE